MFLFFLIILHLLPAPPSLLLEPFSTFYPHSHLGFCFDNTLFSFISSEYSFSLWQGSDRLKFMWKRSNNYAGHLSTHGGIHQFTSDSLPSATRASLRSSSNYHQPRNWLFQGSVASPNEQQLVAWVTARATKTTHNTRKTLDLCQIHILCVSTPFSHHSPISPPPLLRSHLGSEAYCFPSVISAGEDLAYAVAGHDPRFPSTCSTLSLSAEDRSPRQDREHSSHEPRAFGWC